MEGGLGHPLQGPRCSREKNLLSGWGVSQRPRGSKQHGLCLPHSSCLWSVKSSHSSVPTMGVPMIT